MGCLGRGLLLALLLSDVARPTGSTAPGLPVFSDTGEIQISRTRPGYTIAAQRISGIDTLADHDARIGVDGHGGAWVVWQSGTTRWIESDGCGRTTTWQGVRMAELAPDATVQRSTLLLPFGDYEMSGYDLTQGPDGTAWCIRQGLPFQCSTEWTDAKTLITAGPCGDMPASPALSVVSAWPVPLLIHDGVRLGFSGDDALLVGPPQLEGSLFVYWVAQDSTGKIPVESHWTWGLGPVRLVRTGMSLAVLWQLAEKMPTSGGYGITRLLVSVLADGTTRWSTAEPMNYTWGPRGLLDSQVFQFVSTKAIGSDGHGRIFVVYVQDDTPKVEVCASRMPGEKQPCYTISAIPRVRCLDATSADSLADWTVGYDTLEVGPIGPEPRDAIEAAITGSHVPAGFLISRAGALDMWVLAGTTWYGPYPVQLPRGVPARNPTIAVDAGGRYWLAWDDSVDVYAASVTLADLGVDAATAVQQQAANAVSASPRPLLTNWPNPFNASTTLDVQIPGDMADMATLSIYDVSGQQVRSLSVKGGRTQVVWDGRDADGVRVGSGVYLCRLTRATKVLATCRLLLIE